MKHRIPLRIASILLAALMCLSIVACATGESDETKSETSGAASSETESTTEYVPPIETKNYDCDFNIVIGGTFIADLILLEQEDNTGDALDTAVYERAVKIEEKLGVTCVLQDAGDWLQYSGNVIRTVQANDDDYQLVLTPVYQGVCDLITKNVLLNFDELPAVNLDAPYWSKQLMDDIMIQDQHILGYNDACLSDVNLIVFNKQLQENFQVESPYTLVREKTWTLDKMMTMASGIHVDDGNGSWGAEDTYGITGWGWVPLISLVTSSGMRIVDRNADGDYVISYDNNKERMLELIDTVFELYNADYSFFWKSVPAAGTQVDFSAGTSLFQFFSSKSLTNFRDKDIRFGVLPYPMFVESQGKYETLNWNGLMTVPNTVRNRDMVGEVLELMAYYTAPVKNAYYEDLLSAKLADAPDDVEMLDIIWSTQVSDVGIFTCNSSTQMDNLVYMIPKMCEAGNNTYSSYLQGNTKAAQRNLDKVFLQGDFARD